MKTDYQERLKNRIENYNRLAKKHHALSDDYYKKQDDIGKRIPFGQPILVGHHSEKAARADYKKIHRYMDKSCEHEKIAKHYENRVLSAESNNTISSDNPEAKDLLEDKVEALESFRDKAKQVNKRLRAGKTIFEMDFLTQDEKEKFIGYLRFDGHIPTYFFSNIGAKIREAKKRKSRIESIEKMEEKEVNWNGVRVVQSPSKNRLQLLFDGKPPQETIQNLKRWGFRWSPTEKAWQRHLSNSATYAAKEVCRAFAPQVVETV